MPEPNYPSTEDSVADNLKYETATWTDLLRVVIELVGRVQALEAKADHHLADEITAIQTELGLTPKGTHPNVSARLNALEALADA